MDELLDQMENSEYGDISGLLEGISDEELLGAVRRNPRKFRKVMTKRSTRTRKTPVNPTSRNEFEQRFGMLDKDIQKKLLNKQLQLVDTELAVAKSISNVRSVKMLQDSDVKSIGVSMINGAKLEKGEVLLLSGIVLLTGIGAGTSDTDLKNTEFGIVAPAIRNGEWEFIANGKTLVPKCSTECFVTHRFRETIHAGTSTTDTGYGFGYAYGQTNHRVGFYKLNNPKLIETQSTMELNVEWGVNAPANAFMKAVLVGSRVYKH